MKTVLRKFVRLLANTGPRGLGVVLIACALAVPAYAYWHSSRPRYYGPAQASVRLPQLVQPGIAPGLVIRYYGPAAQVSVRLPRKPSLRAMPDYRHGVVVLCYHDLSYRRHNRYTVRPDAFAAQMAALRASGFHTVSGAEFAAFVRVGREPRVSRPLFITFDDGAKGTWTYADRILRRLSYQATVFLITGDVSHHQPYYLDWPEVQGMARSGRWSFGAHTYDGHGQIATDRAAHPGPFLTNRMWLPHANRVETLNEYRARVSHDLDRSIADIHAHGLPRPNLFAYPFSATVQPTNDPRTTPLLKQMLAERFWGLVDNTPSATLVRPAMRGPLPRVEVFDRTRATQLLDRIRSTIARRHGRVDHTVARSRGLALGKGA